MNSLILDQCAFVELCQVRRETAAWQRVASLVATAFISARHCAVEVGKQRTKRDAGEVKRTTCGKATS